MSAKVCAAKLLAVAVDGLIQGVQQHRHVLGPAETWVSAFAVEHHRVGLPEEDRVGNRQRVADRRPQRVHGRVELTQDIFRRHGDHAMLDSAVFGDHRAVLQFVDLLGSESQ